jgi:hypothetical protein
MKWNGKSYRPINQIQIKKREFDLEDALRPLGQKVHDTHWVANVFKTDGPPPSPSVTPTNTVTPSVTPTNTVTPSITPSVTPTITSSVTPSTTVTPSITPSVSISPSVTPTNTVTPSVTPTNTPTPSISSSPSGTTEANTYLTAVVTNGGTGINSTISAATRTLFTTLVSQGVWDKLSVFYPILGATANSTKVNGKNPGTNDMVWNG